jgi:Protein of unknown function (DUF3592)
MSLLEISGLIIFFILGLYLFTFGVKKYIALTKLRKDGQVADAEVIALKIKNLNYTPIISFIDHKNKRQKGIAKNTIQIKRFSNYRIGNKVKVLYDPKDCSNFVIDELADRLLPLFFCGVGLVFMLTISYVIIFSIF